MVHGHNMRAVRIAHPEEWAITNQAATRAIWSIDLDDCAETQVAVPELLDGAILVLNVMERVNTGLCDSMLLGALLVNVGAGVNKPHIGVLRIFRSGLLYVLFVTDEHVGLLEDIPMDVSIGDAILLIIPITTRNLIHAEVKCQVMEHIRNRALEEVLQGCLRSNESLNGAKKGFVTLIVIGNACSQTD
jgi:hypothetical protein